MRLTTKNHYSKEAERDVQAAFRPPGLTAGAPHGRNARAAQADEQQRRARRPVPTRSQRWGRRVARGSRGPAGSGRLLLLPGGGWSNATTEYFRMSVFSDF